MKRKFYYNIDVCRQTEEWLELQGWRFHSDHTVDVKVLDGSGKRLPFRLYPRRRPDVAQVYENSTGPEQEIGFVLQIATVDSDEQMELVFQAGKEIYSHKIDRGIAKKDIPGEYNEYHKWMKEQHRISKKKFKAQRLHPFRQKPLIDVIRIYREPDSYKDVVKLLYRDSVVQQSYDNWAISQVRTIEEGIARGLGEWILIMEEGDSLEPDALFQVVQTIEKNPFARLIYMDEDIVTDRGRRYYAPHFKPDYNSILLENENYIGRAYIVRRELAEAAGGYREDMGEGADYDFVLRCCDMAGAKEIEHIPKVLFHRNERYKDRFLTAKSQECVSMEKRALKEHLERISKSGKVSYEKIPGLYRISHEIQTEPSITIVIPNKDHQQDLEKCLVSIRERSTYSNYEILIVENNSQDSNIFSYYATLEKEYPKVRIITWEGIFNYAAINNFAAEQCISDYILFLNNDVEVITPSWLEELIGYALRDKVGAVGAGLLYPNGSIQHAGVVMGLGGVASHIFCGNDSAQPGYMRRAMAAQNISAVTAACMLVSRKIFSEVEGFDEGFEVAYNDIDLCMKISKAGYSIVENPRAQLYHYESVSRGAEDDSCKQRRFQREADRFKEKWPQILEKGDPYFNPNLYQWIFKLPLV